LKAGTKTLPFLRGSGPQAIPEKRTERSEQHASETQRDSTAHRPISVQAFLRDRGIDLLDHLCLS